MHRHGKHIHRAHLLHLISSLAQIFQIPCQGGGIAAYVHNSVRLHFYDRVKQYLVAAFSRGIYNDHIGPGVFARMTGSIICIVIRKDFFSFSYIEFCILYTIQPCIAANYKGYTGRYGVCGRAGNDSQASGNQP